VTSVRDGSEAAGHIIGEVQRFGLLSAAAVVDRYVEIINREKVRHPLAEIETLAGDTEGAGGGAAAMLRAGLQALDAAARLVSDAVTSETETLVLPRTRPGGDAEASMWVHNRTSSVVASVELRATVLISDAENTIPGDAVTFHPENAVILEPGTSRAVSARVSVPKNQPPGLYHGLVTGSGAPDGAVTLRLAVEDDGGTS
jgi:hypothetical protein